MVNTECQQIKNKLHSCDRFVQTSERYSDLMEMSFEDEEEAFLVTFFLSNQPPKVVFGKFTSDKLIGHIGDLRVGARDLEHNIDDVPQLHSMSSSSCGRSHHARCSHDIMT